VATVENEIMLRIREKDSYVAANDFIETASIFLSLLNDVEISISNDKKSNLNWIVKDLRCGSAVIALSAIPKEPVNYSAEDVIGTVISGLQSLETGKNVPQCFTEEAIGKAKYLALKIGKGISDIMISTTDNIVNLTHNVVVNAEAILNAYTIDEYGTITGFMKMITTVGSPYFGIYDSVTGKRVICDFDNKSLKAVLAGMERGRVSVSGLISYGLEGFPKKIKHAEIELLPMDDELPSFNEIINLDLDLSGGLSLEEFMEKKQYEK
jgi:hypothetical protein